MFEDFIRQLTSDDPAQRRDAIIGMGKLGDPRALSYLGQVYKTDPDPALRDLAAKAGRHIQKLRQSTPRPPIPPTSPFIVDKVDEVDEPPPPRASNLPDILANYMTPSANTYEPPPQDAPRVPDSYTPGESPLAPLAPIKPIQPKPPEIDISRAKPITKQKQQQAKGRLNNAFSYKTLGNDQDALAELAYALQLNPGLAEDRSAMNLASSLVGGSGKESIALVLKKSQEGGGIKRQSAAFDTEIWDMLLSAAILFVVIVLFSVAFFYATMIIQRVVFEMASKSAPQTNDIKEMFSGFSLQDILPDVLRTTAVTVGSTFFQTIVIYLVGTMMGGVASFIRFAKVMMNVQTVFYILLMVGFGLMIFGMFSDSMETFETMVQLGLLVLGIVFVGGMGIQGYVAGRVQEFGFFKGMASVAVGSTAAGVFAGWTGMFNIQP
jgi:hypothetical protein